MHLYLIRHAVSEWQTGNSKSNDSNISILGEKQRVILKEHMEDIIGKTQKDFIIFSSPLKRSLQTVKILGLQYEIIDDLKESLFHVASVLPEFKYVALYKQQNVENNEYIIFKNNLRDLLGKVIHNNKEKNIFMFTHAGVIKTLLRIFHDNDAIDYIINNCSITKISWYRNRWSINYINDTSFLPRDYIT